MRNQRNSVTSEPYVEVDDEFRLLGSSCQACALTTYPMQRGCPRCGTETMQRRVLPARGTLWSYTVQYFPPKLADGPGDLEAFQPYGVGYVQLGDEVIVEVLLTENDPELLEIGMTMDVADPRSGTDDHTEIGSLRFRPRRSEVERA